jgi:hypothetical protein
VTVILYETRGTYRQIFTDGRALPKDPNPSWMGYSVGRWERDVFVVESAGFNSRTWRDGIGHPHGEQLRLTERFTGGISATSTSGDDWPWTAAVVLELAPDTDFLEDVCLENERDARHLVGK